MSEPRLEDISDYDTMPADKRKVFIIIALSMLFVGIIYTVISSNYKTVDDALPIDKTFKQVPLK
ncbi:MAG: hypothetical protein Q9M43_11050 [Sulfurimonas sp.]|nr:hypothetical protein [Sulfurimonas sp.]